MHAALLFSAISSVHANRCVYTVTFIWSALESSIYIDDISVETEAETPFESRVVSENEAYTMVFVQNPDLV